MHTYYQTVLDTPLGPMLAIGDEEALYLLEFVERPGLDREVARLGPIVPGCTKPMRLIEGELHRYFEGKITQFTTPLSFIGSHFQKQVWQELQKIPLGGTRSYADIAIAIGRPSAFRAVGRAIGSNQLAVIVPCHRVIKASGAAPKNLGGYAGGLERKKWLLDHEKTRVMKCVV